VLLTALVVDAGGDHLPNEGFFRMCAREGFLGQEHAPPVGEPWVMTDSQRVFARSAIEQAYRHFRADGDVQAGPV